MGVHVEELAAAYTSVGLLLEGDNLDGTRAEDYTTGGETEGVISEEAALVLVADQAVLLSGPLDQLHLLATEMLQLVEAQQRARGFDLIVAGGFPDGDSTPPGAYLPQRTSHAIRSCGPLHRQPSSCCFSPWPHFSQCSLSLMRRIVAHATRAHRPSSQPTRSTIEAVSSSMPYRCTETDSRLPVA